MFVPRTFLRAVHRAEHTRRPAFTLLEVAVVLTVTAIIAAVVAVSVGSPKEKAYRMTMLKDLERYAAFQESHHDATLSYAAAPASIAAYQLSADVQTVRSEGWTRGYALVVGHAKTATRCQLVFLRGPSTASRPICSASAFGPTAVIEVTPSPATVGQTVTFRGTHSLEGDGAIVAFAWAFSDGVTASDSVTTKTFAAPGEYTATLRVTDNAGRWAETTARLTVTTAATADFVLNPNPARVNELVTMTALPGDAAELRGVTWEFGDSETGVGLQAEHRYATAGTKTVTMRVTDANGALGTVSKTLTVSGTAGPTAAFSVDPLDPSPNEPVVFDGSASSDPDGQVMRWQWVFGDGAVAEGPSATHAYSAPGVYTATLTVTDDNGLQASASKAVSVTTQPMAYFSAAPNPVVAGRPVAFDGSASVDPDGVIEQWSWGWGDGSATTAQTTPTTSHIYATAGQYTATLLVRGSSGRVGRRQGTITVTANQAPVVTAITCTPTPLSTGVPATCTAAGSDPDGSIVQWEWSFSDNGASPTGNPVAHTFATSGSHTVKARATDDLGLTSGWLSVVVSVNAPPVAAFSWNTSPNYLVGGRVVNFVDGSTDSDGTIVAWSWNFGGQGTSATQHPSFTFAAAGTYLVTLVVTDAAGATATTSQSLTVAANQAPTAAFTLSPTYPEPGATVTVTSQSADADGTIAWYAYDHSAGWSANGATLTTTTFAAPATPGSYTVGHSVNDDLGASAYTSRTLVVNGPPTCAFGSSTAYSLYRVGRAITYTSTSSDPDDGLASQTWTFSDGGTASGASVGKTFGAPGTYSAILTVTDTRGSSRSCSAAIVVAANQAPVASFSYSPASPKVGESVTFNGSASYDPDGALVAYSWSFGDGGTGTGPSLVRTFGSGGTVTATLTVTDDLGASTSTTQSLTITCSDPFVVSGPTYVTEWRTDNPDGSYTITKRYETVWSNNCTTWSTYDDQVTTYPAAVYKITDSTVTRFEYDEQLAGTQTATARPWDGTDTYDCTATWREWYHDDAYWHWSDGSGSGVDTGASYYVDANRTSSAIGGCAEASDPTAVVGTISLAPDYVNNKVRVTWTLASGTIGTGSYEVWVVRSDGAPIHSNPIGFVGGTPSQTLDHWVPEDITSTTGPKVSYSYKIRVLNASNKVVRTSAWKDGTYSHAGL